MDAVTPVPTEPAANEALHGLDSARAKELLARDGPNSLPERHVPPWRRLLGHFSGPVPWMLEAVALLQWALGRHLEAGVIGALLAFNALMAAWQEGRARGALSLLRQSLQVRARVLRDGQWHTLPAAELVVGDVVHVRAGDVLSADLELLDGRIAMDNAALTGESLPVEVAAGGQAFAGAVVRQGEASARVVGTGTRTRFGKTAELVHTAHAPGHMQRTLLQIVKRLLVFDAVLAVLGAGIAWWHGLPAVDILVFVLMLLVASVPVALPATYTLATALAARQLAQDGVLVTHLAAVEEAASMDTLVSDKTGTLTQNRLSCSGVQPLANGADAAAVLRAAALASDDATQDPIDLALIEAARGLDQREVDRVLRGVVAGQRGGAQHSRGIRAVGQGLHAAAAQPVLGQRAGLVRHQRVHGGSLLHRGQVRDQHPVLRELPRRQRRGQRVGGRQRDRHRGHQQHQHEHQNVHRRQPVPPRNARAQHRQHGIEHQQPLHDLQQRALHVARRMGGVHELGRLAKPRARARAHHPRAGLALAHHGAGKGLAASRHLHRQRFAGQGGVVHGDAAVQQFEVGAEHVARAHMHHVAHHQFGRRQGVPLAITQHPRAHLQGLAQQAQRAARPPLLPGCHQRVEGQQRPDHAGLEVPAQRPLQQRHRLEHPRHRPTEMPQQPPPGWHMPLGQAVGSVPCKQLLRTRRIEAVQRLVGGGLSRDGRHSIHRDQARDNSSVSTSHSAAGSSARRRDKARA